MKYTEPVGGTFNCAGALSPAKPQKVRSTPQQFAKVVFSNEGHPIRNSNSLGLYQGAELRPFTGRDGANDALRVKSLVTGPKTRSEA